MKYQLGEIILYVANQEKSTSFYTQLLKQSPVLHVPGMTEFILEPGIKLGLMPETGIAKILEPSLPAPALGNGLPRCELYLFCENPEQAFSHALSCGAVGVSEAQDRDWGDCVAYVADPDGHVLAFARKSI